MSLLTIFKGMFYLDMTNVLESKVTSSLDKEKAKQHIHLDKNS